MPAARLFREAVVIRMRERELSCYKLSMILGWGGNGVTVGRFLAGKSGLCFFTAVEIANALDINLNEIQKAVKT